MPARYTSARFVGREDAFAKLATVIRSSAAGESATLLIDGTAGVGTSRFIDEAIRRVSGLQEPMTVMRGAAYGAATDAPYEPLVRALRPALEELSDDDLADVLGPAADEIVRLIPGLASRVDGPRTAGPRLRTVVPERRQPRLLEGVLGVLGRLGERRPVLLIIEDLHRADAGTRALVTFLARIARSHRLAIVATYQADAIRREDPWSLDLVGLAAAPRPPSTLTLPPLSRDELARLIAAIEEERPSASVLVVVAERSGGRPLVAEELLAARRELPGVSLTSSFQDLVLARIAARSPEARRALRLIAPAGRPLGRAGLAAIADAFEAELTGGPPRSSNAPRRGDGVLDADLTHGLDEAIEYGFVREDDDGLALRHELVGQAIEADLLPSMEPGAGRMDFEFASMSGDLVDAIEAAVNVELRAERDVRVDVLPRAKAFAIPDLIRTKINLLPEGIEEIRTIEIVGLDLQADGGTHVANTREVGRIRVTGYESKGRINKRIRIELVDPDGRLRAGYGRPSIRWS